MYPIFYYSVTQMRLTFVNKILLTYLLTYLLRILTYTPLLIKFWSITYLLVVVKISFSVYYFVSLDTLWYKQPTRLSIVIITSLLAFVVPRVAAYTF